MKVTPDYSEVKSIEPLPSGTYCVRLVGAEVKKMKDGMPQINWTAKVFGSSDVRWNERTIYLNTPIGGQFAFILKKFLLAANPDYQGGEFDTEDYLGRKLEVTIEQSINKQTGEISMYPNLKKVAAFVDPDPVQDANENYGDIPS